VIGIVLKRSALSLWENIFVVFLGNILFSIASILAVFGAIWIGVQNVILGVASLGVVAAILAVIFAIYAGLLRDIVRREEIGLGRFLTLLAQVWLPATLWAFSSVGLVSFLVLGATAARSSGDALGGAALLVAIWVLAVWVQVSLFFFALISRNRGDISATLKSCLLLALHNPGFSLVLLIVVLLLVPLSITGLPGPGGIMILVDHAAELRLRRYIGTGDARSQDWDALLASERHSLSNVSLLNILLPWRP